MTVSISEDFARRADPFRRELLAHCYRILGYVHDAEDLVQETLLRAWRHPEALDPDRGSVRAWLFTTARNLAIDSWRRRSVRPATGVLMDDAVCQPGRWYVSFPRLSTPDALHPFNSAPPIPCPLKGSSQTKFVTNRCGISKSARP